MSSIVYKYGDDGVLYAYKDGVLIGPITTTGDKTRIEEHGIIQ